jgi:hypothetical protein
MPQADHLTDAQIRQIVAMIAEQKQAFATGIEGLYTLKKVLEHAVHRMGIAVEWDPSTPPAVRDRFAIVSLSALQWSFGGAALGLMIGVFTERPALWARRWCGDRRDRRRRPGPRGSRERLAPARLPQRAGRRVRRGHRTAPPGKQ